MTGKIIDLTKRIPNCANCIYNEPIWDDELHCAAPGGWAFDENMMRRGVFMCATFKHREGKSK